MNCREAGRAYTNGMDPSLFSLGSEELKMMFGAALNLKKRVMHAGDDDGDRLSEAGLPGSRDRHTWYSFPKRNGSRGRRCAH